MHWDVVFIVKSGVRYCWKYVKKCICLFEYRYLVNGILAMNGRIAECLLLLIIKNFKRIW